MIIVYLNCCIDFFTYFTDMCPIREKFGCPITITVIFRPETPTSINAHLIGLAIRAKLNIILPQNQFKLDIFVEDDKHINKQSIDR